MWSAEACRRFVTPRLAGARARARKTGRGEPRSAEAPGPQKARPMKARASSRTPYFVSPLIRQSSRFNMTGSGKDRKGSSLWTFFDSEERGMRGEGQIRKELPRFSTCATGCGSGGNKPEHLRNTAAFQSVSVFVKGIE